MQTKSSPRVEQDYRIFFVFMTFVMVAMYTWTLVAVPSLRTSWLVVPFTLLLAIHIIAHWNVNRLIQNRSRIIWYILAQSALAFMITNLSGNIGMLFALYMALIGETIGFLGINRWGILSIIFYLALSLANFVLFTAREGAFFWLLTSIPTVIFVSMYVTLYTRQAEAREQAQTLASELELANRQLSEYAARVEDLTIANERQRMARELHDTLSQGLAGLILQLEAADAHLVHDRPGRAREIVQDAMERARATLADARRAISNLREQTDVVPLDEAVRREVERFTQATGIPCETHFQLETAVPDKFCEPTLRIVTEALTNIGRHAQATQAELNLSTNGEELYAEVWDNGLGFDTSKMDAGHYGLLGMCERARLAGGRLEVQSEAGKGTRVNIHFPLVAE